MTYAMSAMGVGQSAIIKHIDTSSKNVIPLMICGFVEGAVVTCKNIGFGKTSMEFEMYGTRTCVPTDTLKYFYVELL